MDEEFERKLETLMKKLTYMVSRDKTLAISMLVVIRNRKKPAEGATASLLRDPVKPVVGEFKKLLKQILEKENQNETLDEESIS